MVAPTLYTPELAESLLEHLRSGEPLTQWCREEGRPKPRTVSDWKRANPEFAAAYAEARLTGADAIADDCLQIADDVLADKDAVARAKLRIDTRLKLLAKWFPTQYGDAVKLSHAGADGQGPVEHVMRWATGDEDVAVKDPSDKP